MDIVDFLNEYGEGVVQGITPNQQSTKPICYSFISEDVDKFNHIYRYLLKSNLNTIIRTASGGIAKGNINRSNRYAWDIITTRLGSRITVCACGITWVFKMGHFTQEPQDTVYPSKAWEVFDEECSKDGIILDEYAEDDGEIHKEDIKMPLIKMLVKNEELDNVHHIDFHNSYPAGLANTHPEFRPTIERLYEKRKENPNYKAVLNYSIGCMQSLKRPWRARWAGLAKDAINDNVSRVTDLAFRLSLSGRNLIGFNTDGIWYQGEIYHGDGEGPGLGQWHNDHINCHFRAKSDGAYEFIEDGTYYPVIRGATKLDAIKPREEWNWGDIYTVSAEIINYTFEEGIGIVYDDTQQAILREEV